MGIDINSEGTTTNFSRERIYKSVPEIRKTPT